MQISGTKNESTADTMAWRWNARPAIQAQLAKMRAEMTEEGALSRAEKRHTLANVVRAEDVETREKLAAIAIDNRMTGDDEPFRKAAGDDLRVQFFVVKIGEESVRGDAVNTCAAVTPAIDVSAAPVLVPEPEQASHPAPVP